MEIVQCSIQDKLDNVPENILENIFSRLSMIDMVRTSVLSTNWRYKWVSFPHLIFNDKCIPSSNGSLDHDKLVKIINHVLVVHRGPIQTFKITSSQLQTCSEIDSWILSLSFHSLTVFELQISKSERHSVLPCLFSFKQLIRLMLIHCIITLPVTFKGFSCLTSLYLQRVTISDVALKCLVSSCHQLERLTLIHIDGPTHIEISNPELKYLHISGNFDGICLKDLRLLVYASFYATTGAYPDRQMITYNFSNILGSLLSIQELQLRGYFLQYFTVSDAEMRLSSTYDHLKTISFSLNAEDMHEILVAICFLNSFPNLEELDIMLWHSRRSAIALVMNIQEAKDQLKSTFNRLRVVHISQFYGIEIELVLVKFILANSPVLETMKICHEINDTDTVLTLSKELLRFKRASPQAEIVY
ncbi:F-box/FBD/LRR-repeat protein At1g13570-like [Macadamia integrifolia]|uniref:F-box/FBD/LRR-repeat protein At1g13570-like n=1 Tax=Macadamia integrifolia TaxID=60698 RepID=UPI001C4FE756|nr:F-box/FBD/LRR-repeat protein At1g13570-like [Macadamia integrifolia]XP_042517612.1 F-box/FBD/LRR-repeat protein At1g13570-like [Macadamia integrifolia]